MIPKISKFPLRTDFLTFRRRASKIVTPHTMLLYLPHTPSVASGEMGRLSVVIPKKVSKLATTRNYLKRLVYDQLWPQLKDQNIDVVVVFKPLPLTRSLATKQLITSELSMLLINPKS